MLKSFGYSSLLKYYIRAVRHTRRRGSKCVLFLRVDSECVPFLPNPLRPAPLFASRCSVCGRASYFFRGTTPPKAQLTQKPCQRPRKPDTSPPTTRSSAPTPGDSTTVPNSCTSPLAPSRAPLYAPRTTRPKPADPTLNVALSDTWGYLPPTKCSLLHTLSNLTHIRRSDPTSCVPPPKPGVVPPKPSANRLTPDPATPSAPGPTTPQTPLLVLASVAKEATH